MKNFPYYPQHDTMDCGPTCLRMVAAFHGKCYSLERLREKSFLTREGVSLLGISEAAEKIGLRSMCVQIGYALLTEAPLPCIVHWNQQHFVVVYKLDKRRVWVADPGAGKLKYTKEEFCRCWLSSRKEGEDRGVALLLEPTPEFYAEDEDEEEKPAFKGFPFLFTYLRPYKQLVGQLLLGLLLGWVGVLCAQNWTSADSLRLQRLLEGEGEIKLNPEALRELEQNFGQPKISEEKPWLKFDETLPMGISEKDKKAKMVLRPYTGYTPYNWDPIRGCKIDIDKPTWKENILRGLDKMLVGAAKPSGLDFMGIFTKEFWNRKIKKRRAATLEALKAYGDSITVYQKEKPHHE